MQTGSIDDALRQADRLLVHDPRLALAQARAILEAAPGHPRGALVEGAALARLGETGAARAVLERLAEAQPGAAVVHLELGLVLAAAGALEEGIAALRQAVALQPDLPQAWRALGDLLHLAGQSAAADAAYARHLRAAVRDPGLMAAGDALVGNDLPRAEALLRAHLKRAPKDVAALRMLAEAGIRLGRYGAAETLLRRALELAPSFTAARHNLALVLYRQNRAIDALPEIAPIVAANPRDVGYRLLLAACLASTGEYAQAIDLYAGLVAESPRAVKIWLGYGHALRTAGRRKEAIAAYRRALAVAPQCGEAWWSLANLKTGALGEADRARMQALLEGTLEDEDRYHIHYALGRALEDAADYAPSFVAYAAGAQLRRAGLTYDAAAATAQVDRTIGLLTPGFFAARAGMGCGDSAPIFIVGLPRSGSTLLEQILSSHPLVEGTMELPELPNVARDIGAMAEYPQALAGLDAAALAALGARYLERARPYRKTARPFFIDKLPNNWIHVGVIRLILPAAKIIDARRGAMAACFSTFTQHFARGQHYSYDLHELGRYWNDYARLMAHLDAVQPGAVHRARYEDVVADTEAEVRRLLAYCGLEFCGDCLRFYENARAVRTASSEQVRRPIFREGLEHWRHYAPWLGALRETLAEP